MAGNKSQTKVRAVTNLASDTKKLRQMWEDLTLHKCIKISWEAYLAKHSKQQKCLKCSVGFLTVTSQRLCRDCHYHNTHGIRSYTGEDE